MKRTMFGIVALGIGLGVTGCAGLNSTQRAEYSAMKAERVDVQEKNPGTAAVLGILPGGGSFYTRQWGLGIVDLLLWPFSILWDPIAGYNEAEMINYTASRDQVRRIVKKEIAELDALLDEKKISQEEYNTRRRAIEKKNDFDIR